MCWQTDAGDDGDALDAGDVEDVRDALDALDAGDAGDVAAMQEKKGKTKEETSGCGEKVLYMPLVGVTEGGAEDGETWNWMRRCGDSFREKSKEEDKDVNRQLQS